MNENCMHVPLSYKMLHSFVRVRALAVVEDAFAFGMVVLKLLELDRSDFHRVFDYVHHLSQTVNGYYTISQALHSQEINDDALKSGLT